MTYDLANVVAIIIHLLKDLGLLTLFTSLVSLLASQSTRMRGKLFHDIGIGGMLGVLSSIVMLDPIQLVEGATFDPRAGPVILAGVFGGPVGALIAATIGGLARWEIVGGPVALGGVVGFALYGVFGMAAGAVITKLKVSLNLKTLCVLGIGGSIAVIPAFFVSTDLAAGIIILKKAGPLLLISNVFGTLLVGWLLVNASNLTDVFKQNSFLSNLARATPSGIIVTNAEGETEWVNETFERISGFKLQELIGKRPGQVLQGSASDQETVDYMSHKIKSNEGFEAEIINYTKAGAPYWVKIDCQPYTDANGDLKYMAIETDISEQKNAEALLIESEARFRDFAESASDFYWEFDEDLKFSYLSESFAQVTGVPVSERLGKTREDVRPVDIDPEVWKKHLALLNSKLPFKEFIHPRPHPDGRTVWLSTSGQPVFDAKGGFNGYRGVGRDITDLIEAQAENARLALAVNNIDILVSLYDEDDRLVLANKKAIELGTELGAKFQVGMTYEEVARSLVSNGQIEDAAGREEEWIQERIEIHSQADAPIEVVRYDGRSFLVYDQKLPDGSISSTGIETTRLKEIERKLRHSQRMEAIGQLTGGIAHDFNNLLGVMLGNAEILERRTELDEKSQVNITQIINATDRAAALTTRLLAFSRQQHLEPQSSNVNELISSLEDMLKRTLGATITLHIGHDADIWQALIDPNQFENAVINLSLNARDAMPDGGSINIDTTNITLDPKAAKKLSDILPGDYVQISIADTGEGIAEDKLERVFEPFYTTKEVGKGSGLGLSMVHGFILQSNGHIAIESELNKGTTINIYVPRCLDLVSPDDTTDSPNMPLAGTERILVVEDDEDLRAIPVGSLRNMGYEVDEAGDGEEALKLFAQQNRYDLLFTDIVLPGGMNGVEIAQEMRSSQPEIKVIYTTGYAEDAVSNVELANIEQNLLRKPYHQSEMLEKIRMALDAAPSSDS